MLVNNCLFLLILVALCFAICSGLLLKRKRRLYFGIYKDAENKATEVESPMKKHQQLIVCIWRRRRKSIGSPSSSTVYGNCSFFDGNRHVAKLSNRFKVRTQRVRETKNYGWNKKPRRRISFFYHGRQSTKIDSEQQHTNTKKAYKQMRSMVFNEFFAAVAFDSF